MANEPGQSKKTKPFLPVTPEDIQNVSLEDSLRATPAERLAYLEEALRLAREAGVVKRE
jgi:hypothetical protein